MSKHDFSALYEKYPEVIAEMPHFFDSHRFIRCIAQKNQDLYVEALYSYRNTRWGVTAAPFMVVHQRLAEGLHRFRELVTHTGEEVTSRDIWGAAKSCALWRKESGA